MIDEHGVTGAQNSVVGPIYGKPVVVNDDGSVTTWLVAVAAGGQNWLRCMNAIAIRDHHLVSPKLRLHPPKQQVVSMTAGNHGQCHKETKAYSKKRHCQLLRISAIIEYFTV
jgi:hypothetical protein